VTYLVQSTDENIALARQLPQRPNQSVGRCTAPAKVGLSTRPTPLEPAPGLATALGLCRDDLRIKRDDLTGPGELSLDDLSEPAVTQWDDPGG
jgi:hypothetical protein